MRVRWRWRSEGGKLNKIQKKNSCFAVMVIVSAILFFWPLGISADETSGLSTGVTVPVIQSMDLNSLSFIFPDVSGVNLDEGFIEAKNAAMITVSSNAPWQLTIQSEDQDMGKVEDNVKQLSDFLWKKSTDASYSAVSTNGQVVDSSAGYADHQNIELDYKMVVGWTRDVPGTYSLTLRFTLSTLH